MSVCSEISTDSDADRARQCEPNRFQESNVDVDGCSGDKSPTFIVTDPDSDIETDAAPDAPRPRGTPIPEPPQPDNLVNDEEIPEKNASYSRSSTKSGKIPRGFFNGKVPRVSGTSVLYNVRNSHNVHIGNNFVYGANIKQPTHNEELVPPTEYEILLSSLKVVSDDHLDCVANNIDKNWKNLGLQLGMKKSALFRFEHDYKDNHHERVYQLLLEWKESTGGPNRAPLLARLSSALWQLRERDALDCLVKLEKDPRLNDL